MARVVVGVPLDLAGSQRQHRLGPVERLDLGLLVDAQHDGPLGRVEVEPDDVGDLGHQGRVGAELEGLGPVGLEAAAPARPGRPWTGSRPPLRHALAAPVGRALGRRERLGQDPLAQPRARTCRGRPGWGASARPARPCSLKRRRHSSTVGIDTPSSSATSTLAAPSAARRTIRARITMRCSVVPARVRARRARLRTRSRPTVGRDGRPCPASYATRIHVSSPLRRVTLALAGQVSAAASIVQLASAYLTRTGRVRTLTAPGGRESNRRPRIGSRWIRPAPRHRPSDRRLRGATRAGGTWRRCHPRCRNSSSAHMRISRLHAAEAVLDAYVAIEQLLHHRWLDHVAAVTDADRRQRLRDHSRPTPQLSARRYCPTAGTSTLE